MALNCPHFHKMTINMTNITSTRYCLNFDNFFSGWELLKDPDGRDHFLSFLEKEYATENLLFVESVWHLKKLPASEVLLRFFSQNKRFREFIPINPRWRSSAALSGRTTWAPRRSTQSTWTPSLTK